MEHPKDILKKFWGFDDFKGSQKEIIAALLEDRDVLALMPTGGGKSLCFQVPALAREGICIVVSPLISLIQNQVDRLRQLGIKAIALTGGIPFGEVVQLLDNCCFGNYKFLYLSPERLGQEMVRERIQRMKVNLLAIDEAHCISQWGHDFRPAYLECSKLRELSPETPIIALTATATRAVANDIVANLKCNDPLVIKDSFARDNIAFSISRAEDKPYRLKQLCAQLEKSAIVYVRTRRSSEELARYLNGSGYAAAHFHGGIPKREKQEKLDLWLKDQVKIMVATNAFGMGIDKPDVALVVHYQIPDCIENYFQEAGRAGRNGEPAEAVLITNKTDEQQLKSQFLSVLPDRAFLKKVYNKLNSYFQIAYAEGKDETFQFNFNAFCGTYGFNSILAYNALRILDQHSVVALTESFAQKTTVQVLAGKQQLFDYLEKYQDLVPVVQTLLRTYGGVFDFTTKINPFLISKKAAVEERTVVRALERLAKDGIIAYQAKEHDLSITFLVPREDDSTINRFAKEVGKRHQLKMEHVQSMLAYVHNGSMCRSRQLLGYFGENKEEDCGICDVCEVRHQGDRAPLGIAKQILKSLAREKQGSRALIASLGHGEKPILRAIRGLLEDGKIRVNDRNEYEIL